MRLGVVLLALGACSPEIHDEHFACERVDRCPDGFDCVNDVCVRNGRRDVDASTDAEIAPCGSGRADCNGDTRDGCETTLGDELNCAACGDVCEPLANTVSTCMGIECRLDCLPGFASCNPGAGDGCETELGTNTDCSRCDDECAPPSECTMRMCATP